MTRVHTLTAILSIAVGIFLTGAALLLVLLSDPAGPIAISNTSDVVLLGALFLLGVAALFLGLLLLGRGRSSGRSTAGRENG